MQIRVRIFIDAPYSPNRAVGPGDEQNTAPSLATHPVADSYGERRTNNDADTTGGARVTPIRALHDRVG
jgi:hypothetical protein